MFEFEGKTYDFVQADVGCCRKCAFKDNERLCRFAPDCLSPSGYFVEAKPAPTWPVTVQGSVVLEARDQQDAERLQKAVDLAFQSGQQKAFADLANWVAGRAP